MKTSKKAARIGSDQLAAGIAAASANAKSRVQMLSGQETDGVSGGIGSIIDVIGSGTVTQGMTPPDNDPWGSSSDPYGIDD